MTLNKINKNMIDPNFVQEVQDTTNKIGNLSELKTTNKTDIVKSVNEVTSQLADKAKKSEVRENTVTRPINVNEMDTETKSLFTGGAVAVVGEKSVGNENIKSKAVSGEKTTFVRNQINYSLERGSISEGNNNNTLLSNRLRTIVNITHSDGLYIVRNNPNFLIGISTYDGVTYDRIDRGWLDQDLITIEKSKGLRFNIKKKDNTDFLDSEIETIRNSIEVRFNFQSASASDVEKNTTELVYLKNNLQENIYKENMFTTDSFELGSISAGVPTSHGGRVRFKNMLFVKKGDVLNFHKDTVQFLYGISVYVSEGKWNGVDYGWMTNPKFVMVNDGYIIMTLRYSDNRVINDLDAICKNAISITSTVSNYVDREINRIEKKVNIPGKQKEIAFNSILVEYGRTKDASYVFVRIPKILNDGSVIQPKVALTSYDGSLSGAKRTTLQYARDNDCIFTLNAGLFNISTFAPVGQLIIDGISLVNTPMASDNGIPIHPDECYPLAIDANGNLTTYPRNANTADMIAAGVKYAVTAWGKLVDNFQIATTDINNEIVHNGKRYIRQSIGQYQNGDYCVCTVDMTRGSVTNEAGLYYEELAQIFVDKGVKFAYSLDGGGSAQTVLGKRQLNPIYEGTDGRKVPTIITFGVK